MIETTCPGCGTITCGADRFELWLCSERAASSYGFSCPQCGLRVARRASDEAIETLIARGVRPIVWQFPAELGERHAGPAFTLDDVIDFHLALTRDDRLAGLVDAA